MIELSAKTAAKLRKFLPKPPPRLAIVLGSGFNALARQVEILAEVPYKGLPGFPAPIVPGHAGRLLFGRVGQCDLLLLCGRSHFYEGLSMAQVTFPIRALAAIGVQTLVLTNAAGGINPRFRPGDLMCVTDHINFMGVNPLRDWVASSSASSPCEARAGRGLRRGDTSEGGPPLPDPLLHPMEEREESRSLKRPPLRDLETIRPPAFVDLSAVYDPELIRLFRTAAQSAKVRLHRGVYIAVSGPSYETPAEIRAFARLGADAIGMSTVPEAIVARHCGMRVAALSCITNLAAGRSRTPIHHSEVLAAGEKAQHGISRLVIGFIELFSRTR